MVVEPTHLKNMSQIGNLPQVGVKIKDVWNHHLETIYFNLKCADQNLGVAPFIALFGDFHFMKGLFRYNPPPSSPGKFSKHQLVFTWDMYGFIPQIRVTSPYIPPNHPFFLRDFPLFSPDLNHFWGVKCSPFFGWDDNRLRTTSPGSSPPEKKVGHFLRKCGLLHPVGIDV